MNYSPGYYKISLLRLACIIQTADLPIINGFNIWIHESRRFQLQSRHFKAVYNGTAFIFITILVDSRSGY